MESTCPVERTLQLVGGKWKLIILWHLKEEKVLRYGELQRLMPSISHKMLSQQLKELEQEGFIKRKEYSGALLKVEYSLSDLGDSFVPIIESMDAWHKQHSER